MMKRLCLALLLWTTLLGNVWAEEPPAEPAMEGRFGIGTTFDGVGLRYWVTDGMAVDANFNFRISDSDITGDGGEGSNDNNGYGAGAALIFLLKRKGSLSFVALTGLDYARTRDELSRENFNFELNAWILAFTGGVGIEYSFQELPDLTFGAFVTGLEMGYRKSESVDSSSFGRFRQESKGYFIDSSPSSTLSIRYYF